jgi:hypothetical protein
MDLLIPQPMRHQVAQMLDLEHRPDHPLKTPYRHGVRLRASVRLPWSGRRASMRRLPLPARKPRPLPPPPRQLPEPCLQRSRDPRHGAVSRFIRSEFAFPIDDDGVGRQGQRDDAPGRHVWLHRPLRQNAGPLVCGDKLDDRLRDLHGRGPDRVAALRAKKPCKLLVRLRYLCERDEALPLDVACRNAFIPGQRMLGGANTDQGILETAEAIAWRDGPRHPK